MRLLKISIENLPLFKGRFEIDFLAEQRVNANNAKNMHCLFTKGVQNYYQNNVIALVGINASGKTSVLKSIAFVCELLNNKPINDILYSEIFDGLDNSVAIFDIFFYAENKAINLLHTEIAKTEENLYIKNEYLRTKSSSKIKSKATLLDFGSFDTEIKRNNDEIYLLDDVSIIIAFNKQYKTHLATFDILDQTNVNELKVINNCPAKLITFFDPNIEYLHIAKNNKKTDIHLRFKGKDEIVLNKPIELNRYLSSGTIKGMNVFVNAMKAFKTGGYLIIDEIENHFNYEIVVELIRFFLSQKINPNGAVLVFSTHYSELLDEFERNDNIYITKNKDKISVEKLSLLLRRNDIKKSDAFKSDFLDGTAPSYDNYIALKQELENDNRRI